MKDDISQCLNKILEIKREYKTKRGTDRICLFTHSILGTISLKISKYVISLNSDSCGDILVYDNDPSNDEDLTEYIFSNTYSYDRSIFEKAIMYKLNPSTLSMSDYDSIFIDQDVIKNGFDQLQFLYNDDILRDLTLYKEFSYLKNTMSENKINECFICLHYDPDNEFIDPWPEINKELHSLNLFKFNE